MPASDYINAAALNYTSNSVLFSFTVGDWWKWRETDESFSLYVLSEMGGCLEIRERLNNCKGVLFSHHNLRLDNVFKKKYWDVFTIFIRRLSFWSVLIASSMYIEETLGMHSQYAKVEKEKMIDE